jgi:hypothetical protein
MVNKNKKSATKSGNTKNGNNAKYVDLLDEDKVIAGQKFVCVSFVSPENILKKKENFYFERFLKYFDFQKSMTKYHQFLNFVSYKYNVDFEALSKDFKEFIESEKDNLLKDSSIEDEYRTFLDKNEEELEKEFYELHNFQTSVRGIKVRGSFASLEEAELRCKLLREQDPNHDIYVGPVGVWMPWEPEAYKTGRVEYLEKELNQLMQEKQKNEQRAKEEFERRVKDAKKKAIEENKKLARQSGNKLTQNIDKQGNLVGIDGMNTTERNIKLQQEQEPSEQSEINDDDATSTITDTTAASTTTTSANLKRELFEGEDIILKRKKE